MALTAHLAEYHYWSGAPQISADPRLMLSVVKSIHEKATVQKEHEH